MAVNKEFNLRINGVDVAIKNTKQLEDSIETLKKSLSEAEFGSAEFNDLQKNLRKANTEMEALEIAVEKFTPEKKLETIASLGEAMAGGFALATGGAALFGKELGLTEETVQKYQAKMESVMVLLQGYKSLMTTLSGENLKNIKALIGMSTATTQVGESTKKATILSKLFGTTTRAAIAATGIGLLLIALTVMITHWETIKKKVLDFARSFEPVNKAIDIFTNKIGGIRQFFAGLIESGKAVFKGLADIGVKFWDSLTHPFDKKREAAFIASFKNLGNLAVEGFKKGVREKNAEIAEELAMAMLQAQVEANKRLVSEIEAGGKDSYAMKKKIMEDELKLLKYALKQEEDATSDAYKEKLKAVLDKESEINVLTIAKRKELHDKAMELAKRNRQAEIDQLSTLLEREKAVLEDQTKSEKERWEALAIIKADELALEKKLLAQKLSETGLTEKEIQAIRAESFTNQLNIQREYENAIKGLDEAAKQRIKEKIALEKELQNQIFDERIRTINRLADDEKKDHEVRIEAVKLATAEELALRKKLYDDKVATAGTNATALLAAHAKYMNDVADITKAGLEKVESITDKWNETPFLDRLFGKNFSEQTFAMISAVGQMTDQIFAIQNEKFDAQMQDLDDRIAIGQEKLDALSQSYEESFAKIDDLESQLKTARGTEREAIIQQLEEERAANDKLAKEKSAQEAQIRKDEAAKIEIEKKRQKQIEITTKLQQAATLVTQVNTAAEAVAAGVKAVSAGSAVPFPGNLIAIISALAAVTAAVLSAKQLASKTKMAKGGLLEGPSHERGGIPVGNTGIEVEGGEFVTNKRATRNNPSVLDTLNRFGDKIKYTLVPQQKFAMGGTLPDFNSINSSVSAGKSSNSGMNDVLAKLDAQNSAILQGLRDMEIIVKPSEIDSEKSKVVSAREYSLR